LLFLYHPPPYLSLSPYTTLFRSISDVTRRLAFHSSPSKASTMWSYISEDCAPLYIDRLILGRRESVMLPPIISERSFSVRPSTSLSYRYAKGSSRVFIPLGNILSMRIASTTLEMLDVPSSSFSTKTSE